jgi:hypothetical protein
MAAKDDEKKKLFILLGLVGVAAVVLLVIYVVLPAMQGSGTDAVATTTTSIPELSPFEIDLSLPLPADSPVSYQATAWPEPIAGGIDHTTGLNMPLPYDPLRIQNIDVVDPGRRAYLDQIRNDWKLLGITETWRWVTVLDARGEPKLDAHGRTQREYRQVWEAFFEGRTRPLGENDRLPGTRFTIEKIRLLPERAFVRLRGDTGVELDIELAPLD